jgi:hypothetical protein
MSSSSEEAAIQRQLWWSLRSSKCFLPNFTPRNWWECDVCVVTAAGYWHEYEIKLSRADLLADAYKSAPCNWLKAYDQYKLRSKLKRNKLQSLRRGDVAGPSCFNYVVPPDLESLVPEWAGIWTAKHVRGAYYTVRIVRPPKRLHRHRVQRWFIDDMRRASQTRYLDHWVGVPVADVPPGNIGTAPRLLVDGKCEYLIEGDAK